LLPSAVCGMRVSLGVSLSCSEFGSDISTSIMVALDSRSTWHQKSKRNCISILSLSILRMWVMAVVWLNDEPRNAYASLLYLYQRDLTRCQTLTLYIWIREVLGSIIRQEPAYSNWRFFEIFFSVCMKIQR
jgi:hypothetical protein